MPDPVVLVPEKGPTIVSEGRLGKFDVSYAFIAQNPTKATKLLSRFLVVRCEPVVTSLVGAAINRYFAYFEGFDEMPKGAEVPQYKVIFHPSDDAVTVERLDVDDEREKTLLAAREELSSKGKELTKAAFWVQMVAGELQTFLSPEKLVEAARILKAAGVD